MSDEFEELPEGMSAEDAQKILGESEEQPEAEVETEAEEPEAQDSEEDEPQAEAQAEDEPAERDREVAGLRNEIRNLRLERRQLREQEEERARAIEELRQAVLQRDQPQQSEEELDVFDRLERASQEQAQRLDSLQNAYLEQRALDERQRVAREIANATLAKTDEFRKQAEDYDQADAWVVEHYREQMRETTELTDEQIEAQLAQARALNAVQALRQGGNPAQLIYEHAKSLGYGGGNGSAAPKRKSNPPRRQAPAPTLSKVGGGASASAGDDPLSQENLLRAAKNQEEWEKLMKTYVYKEAV